MKKTCRLKYNGLKSRELIDEPWPSTKPVAIKFLKNQVNEANYSKRPTKWQTLGSQRTQSKSNLAREHQVVYLTLTLIPILVINFNDSLKRKFI